MNINEILNQLDRFFDTGQLDKAEDFLNEHYQQAMARKDSNTALTILNEQIGFYRVTTQYEKALQVIAGIETLIAKNHLENTRAHGTSLLNIATVYRAMGRLAEAQNCYRRAELIYENELEADDYEMASLWNNRSLLYLEQGQYAQAVTYLQKALAVISKKPECKIQTAVTYTNLGQAYLRLEDWQQAEKSLDEAEGIFAQYNFEDEHYSGCAVARGFLYLQKKDYEKAVDSYEKALLCVERYYGRTANFHQIRKDLMEAYRLKGEPVYDSMLDVCQAYYNRYGRPMLEQKFPDYVNRIAVGLCGEGSECLGLEDEISLDHDCGPGFSLWVTDEVYQTIGKELQAAYEKLPKVFAGYIRRDTAQGKARCGVCRIDDYFTRVLGGRSIPESPEEWSTVEESALATAVSGRVFTDPEGIFSQKREKLLNYYPHNVWIQRLARELLRCAQSGQYNYGRAMARQDYVTASLALAEYMKSMMQVVYLLNRTYSPYYKWQHAMLRSLMILPEVGSIMEAIADMPSQREAWQDFDYRGEPNPNDMIAQTIEIVAKLVVHTLREMKLSDSEDVYLEIQAQSVLQHMDNTDWAKNIPKVQVESKNKENP